MGGNVNWDNHCGKQHEVPQKIRRKFTIGLSNPFPGYLREKFENIYLQIYMHPHVHCNIIHSGQDMETTKEPLSRSLDTKIWYIYAVE